MSAPVKEGRLWRSKIGNPTLAVKGAICFTCYKVAPKLNRCGGCKRVWYCSQECQKKGWKKNHKKLCPKLNEINKVIHLAKAEEPQTWNSYRTSMLAILEMLSRLADFDMQEQRFIRYQPYCGNCYRSIFQLPPGTTLRLCSACQLAHFCSTCAFSHELNDCASLKEIADAERFEMQHILETDGDPAPLMLTNAPRSTYVPLSTANSWYDYYTRISDKTMIYGLVSPDLKPLANNAEMASALTAATDENTMILTTVAALEATYDLAAKQSVNLHLIGATSRELEALMCFEEILHIVPSLQAIHCSFIGIDMPKPIDGTKIMKLDCCPSCTSSQRTRSMDMWKGTYQEFLKNEQFKKPDLVVAFQTGHTFEATQSWAPTIKHLVEEADYPSVFTTYNEAEMLDEVKALRKLGARLLIEGKNPWRSMRPQLDPLEEVENISYYFNQYWYVVKGNGTAT